MNIKKAFSMAMAGLLVILSSGPSLKAQAINENNVQNYARSQEEKEKVNNEKNIKSKNGFIVKNEILFFSIDNEVLETTGIETEKTEEIEEEETGETLESDNPENEINTETSGNDGEDPVIKIDEEKKSFEEMDKITSEQKSTTSIDVITNMDIDDYSIYIKKVEEKYGVPDMSRDVYKKFIDGIALKSVKLDEDVALLDGSLGKALKSNNQMSVFKTSAMALQKAAFFVSSEGLRWDLTDKWSGAVVTGGPIFKVSDRGSFNYCFDADNSNYIEGGLTTYMNDRGENPINAIEANGYNLKSILNNSYPNNASGALTGKPQKLALAISQYAIWEARHNYVSQWPNQAGWRSEVDQVKNQNNLNRIPEVVVDLYNGSTKLTTLGNNADYAIQMPNSVITSLKVSSNTPVESNIAVKVAGVTTNLGTVKLSDGVKSIPWNSDVGELTITSPQAVQVTNQVEWLNGGSYQDVISVSHTNMNMAYSANWERAYADITINKKMVNSINQNLTASFSNWSNVEFKVSSSSSGYNELHTLSGPSKKIQVPIANDYKVVETKTNGNFNLNNTVFSANVQANPSTIINVENVEKMSGISIQKTLANKNGNDLTPTFANWSSIKFRVKSAKLGYDKVHNLTGPTTTIPNLVASDDYIVVETQTDPNFELSTTIFNLVLLAGKTTNISVANIEKVASITINKELLNKNGMDVSSGFVANDWKKITFRLQSEKLKYNQVVTLSSKQLTVSNLVASNDYKLTELTTHENFEMHGKVESLILSPGSNTPITIKNIEKMGDIHMEKELLNKLDQDVSGKISNYSDFKFRIYSSRLSYSEDFTLNSLDLIVKNLVASTDYKIIEINSHNDFIHTNKVYDFKVNPGEKTELNIINREKTSQVLIDKLLLNKMGMDISQKFTKNDWNDIVFNLSSKKLKTSNNYALRGPITALDSLPATDDYILKEISTHGNLVLDKTIRTLELKPGVLDKKVSVINVEKTGKLIINKNILGIGGENLNKTFADWKDIEFKLESVKLNYSHTFNLTESTIEINNLTVSDDYTLRETKTNKYLALYSKTIPISILPDQTAKTTIDNYKRNTEIKLIKETNYNNLRENATYGMFDVNKKLLKEVTTNEKGEASFGKLYQDIEKVEIYETVAPKGTFLSEEVYRVNLVNPEIEHKVTVGVVNRQKEEVTYKGKKLVRKVDGKEEPLQDITFYIIDYSIVPEKTIGEVTSSQDGKIELPLLPLVDSDGTRHSYLLREKVYDAYIPLPDILLNDLEFDNLDGVMETLFSNIVNVEKVFSLKGKKIAEANDFGITGEGSVYYLYDGQNRIVAKSTPVDETGSYYYHKIADSNITKNMYEKEFLTNEFLELDKEIYKVKDIDLSKVKDGDVLLLESHDKPHVNELTSWDFSKLDVDEIDLDENNKSIIDTEIRIWEVTARFETDEEDGIVFDGEVKDSWKPLPIKDVEKIKELQEVKALGNVDDAKDNKNVFITKGGFTYAVIEVRHFFTEKEGNVIKGIKKDSSYVIEEVNPPIGYNNDEAFHLYNFTDTEHSKKIELRNSETKTLHTKVDEGGEYVEGAEISYIVKNIPQYIKDKKMWENIELQDEEKLFLYLSEHFEYEDTRMVAKLLLAKEGEVGIVFTTGNRQTVLENVPVGYEFEVIETKVPNGYEQASDEKLTVNNNEIAEVTQVDKKIFIPETGIGRNKIFFKAALASIILVLLLITSITRKYKKNKRVSRI